MGKSKLVKFRADAASIALWTASARARQQSISDFARDALDAAAVELMTSADLDRRLLDLRSTLNAAGHVRTNEQRLARIENALQQVQQMLDRDEAPDA